MSARIPPVRVLIVGHSHVTCLERAQQVRPRPGVTIVNARRIEQNPPPAAGAPFLRRAVHKVRRMMGQEAGLTRAALDRALDGIGQVDAVCLCLAGNSHNILSLIEHPLPFALGVDAGAAPADPERQFVPSGVMRDVLRARYARFFEQGASVYARFQGARRLCLNPPPPMGDRDHIADNPGIFADKMRLGVAPDGLRMAMYRLQSEVVRAFADQNGATFIAPPSRALDAHGFLSGQFSAADSTHGNTAYGQLVLDDVLAQAEASA